MSKCVVLSDLDMAALDILITSALSEGAIDWDALKIGKYFLKQLKSKVTEENTDAKEKT